jgi:2,3-dihydroxyphenylpropionate 1,2-dioxygenase
MAMSGSAYLACVVHVPLLSMQERAVNMEMWQAYDARVAEFHQFDPELVIVFGGDHYDNVFLNLSPQFMIGHQAWAVDDCGGRPGRLDVPLDISRACAKYLVEAGFDIATSYDMGVDHGFSNVLGNFLGELDAKPVLPIFVNALADPRPTLRRCRQIGEAVGMFARRLGKRVAFLGSGGLSHNTDAIFPQFETAPNETMRDYIVSGGTRGEITRDAFIQKIKDDMDVLSAGLVNGTHKVPWISQEWDQKFLTTFVSGDLMQFDSWTDKDILENGGGGASEVRQWIAAAAAATAAGAGQPVLDYYSATTTLAVGVGVAHSH